MFAKPLKIYSSILLLLILFGCQAKNTPAPDKAEAAPIVNLPTALVTRQNIQTEVNISGTVGTLPNTSAKVSPALAGKLVAVNVIPGQQVTKGQIIARLDNRQATDQLNQSTAALRSAQAAIVQAHTGFEQAQINLNRTRQLYKQEHNPSLNPNTTDPAIRTAQASVVQAQSNVEFARQNLERQKILTREGIAPRKDLIAAQNQLDTAQATLAGAKATVQQVIPEKDLIAAESAVKTTEAQLASAIATEQQARASREQVQNQLSYYDVRSPITGTVASRALNVGDSTDQNTPIIQIVNLSTVVVNANLPADQQANIRTGHDAIIRTLNGQTLNGIVTSVNPIVDAQSNTVGIQIRVSNTQGLLKQNQTVNVKIITGNKNNVITVPLQALVPNPENPSGKMVYVVEGGKMTRKKVETGIQQNGRVEIISGLTGNETIVERGTYGLPDGTKISEAKK